MAPDRLSPEQLHDALAGLPHWQLDAAAGAITRTLRCADFAETFALMGRIALQAQALDHHPDAWTQRGAELALRLCTHDAGGPSALDLQLAAWIDALHARWTTALPA